LISTWRRSEELLAAARFGYTVRVQPLEEVILRSGSMDPTTFRAPAVLDADPLVDRVTSMIRLWNERADILLLPAGLGGHVDHRIVAGAGVRALRAGLGPIGFYEDRPYAAYMDDADIAEGIASLGVVLHAQETSGPIRAVRRIYRSQMNSYFIGAQQRDAVHGRCERIWVP